MEDALAEAILKLKTVTDRLGKHVDQNIIVSVACLNLNEFVTYSSCEGHPNRATGGPYIAIQAQDAHHYEQLMRQTELSSEPFKQLYEELKTKNLSVRACLQLSLDAFYENRSSNQKITIRNIGPGASKLHCTGIGAFQTKNPTEQSEWLRAAQLEFADFGRWVLAQKYAKMAL